MSSVIDLVGVIYGVFFYCNKQHPIKYGGKRCDMSDSEPEGSVHSSDEEQGPEEYVEDEEQDAGNVQQLTGMVSKRCAALCSSVERSSRCGCCLLASTSCCAVRYMKTYIYLCSH